MGSLRARGTVLPVCPRVARRPLQSRVAGWAGVARCARRTLWSRALVGLAEPVLAVLALALLAVMGSGHVHDPVPRLRADAVLGVGAVEQTILPQIVMFKCHTMLSVVVTLEDCKTQKNCNCLVKFASYDQHK